MASTSTAVKAIAVTAVGFYLAACGKKQAALTVSQQNLTPIKTGTIVQNVTPDDMKKLEVDGVEFRRVYGDMIEVHGLTEDQIKEKLPNTETQPNIYFPNLVPTGQFDVASGLEGEIKECQKGPNPPKGKVKLPQASSPLFKKNVFNISVGHIELDAVLDQANSDATVFWALWGPQGSKYKKNITKGLVLDFNPDKLGSYMIALVVKDKNKVCSMTQAVLGVTDNVAFRGAQSARAFNTSDRTMFKHLDTIDVEKAWSLAKGRGVKVAIVDSGVNYNHPDLSGNIIVNSREIPNNGIDDDHNGLIDDVTGYDFAMDDSTPYDDNMHGTHVAGLAAGGVAGVAPEAQILPVKVMNATGGGELAAIVAGIKYAADQGVDVINLSLGGEGAAMGKYIGSAIEYAHKKGVLVIAAAGNGDDQGVGFDISARPVFPAAIGAINMLVVAATSLEGEITGYSNFSSNLVNVAAPGGSRDQDHSELMSCNYDFASGNMYVAAEGTSMATPVVAGLAALVKSVSPNLTNVQVKGVIEKTVTKMPGLRGKVKTGGLVNALEAVKSVQR